MCSRVIVKTDHGFQVIRTEDWLGEITAEMTVTLPGQPVSTLATPAYSTQASWQVKYRSINIAETGSFGGVVLEAVNERGLSSNIQYMDGGDQLYHLDVDNGAPAVNLFNVCSYFVENYATTQEVLDALEKGAFQIAWNAPPVPGSDDLVGGHFSVVDRTGHIILFQFGPQGQVVYDSVKGDTDIVVMTNEPLMPEMRQFRSRASCAAELAGDISSKARDQRLSFYLPQLKLEGLSPAETEGKVNALMDTAVAPFDVVDEETGQPGPTHWKIQYNLNSLEFTFHNNVVNRDLRFNWDDISAVDVSSVAELQSQALQGRLELRPA